ncbi:SURF1 family protein [Marivita hallyeonensis]|uniref:SURF1-like protein n=1 Tax=Marivita hallyeonensis TaxID=996342 RepID=A0A1M5WCS0_9RHOB|nr:SURF1 family protein [Marivita hallyeonensis]SHH85369.1 surfeit locus 1 family protein [Marivita hallyeonensis]
MVSRLAIPLLFGLIGTAILVWLGTWQMQRLEWKRGILNEIETRIDGPFEAIPPSSAVIPARDRYTPVALIGEIGEEELLVLVSQKRVGAGYRVISPYTLNDGRRVLLDRGVTPVDQRDADRSRAGETVEVQGNLHWPDDRTSSTPENDVGGNTWFARDIDRMSEVLGTEPLLVIARNMSPPDPSVTPLPVDTSGIPNDHLQYAITWYSLAAVWVIMTGAFIWRQRKGKEG